MIKFSPLKYPKLIADDDTDDDDEDNDNGDDKDDDKDDDNVEMTSVGEVVVIVEDVSSNDNSFIYLLV
jgi:hypothetical protein